MSREEVHSYLKEKFAFPEYYGKNLDALYDCLTDIGRPTAVGIFISETNHFAEETDVVLDNGCIGSENSGAELHEPDDGRTAGGGCCGNTWDMISCLKDLERRYV